MKIISCMKLAEIGSALFGLAVLASPAIAQDETPGPQNCLQTENRGVPGIDGKLLFQPDPPVFRSQGKIIEFADVNDSNDDQKKVQDFEYIPMAVRKPGKEPFDELVNIGTSDDTGATDGIYRFFNDTGEPTGKKEDRRSNNDRYLKYDHPKGQPNTEFSQWRRVRCVPNELELKLYAPALDNDEFNTALPLQWRKRDYTFDTDADSLARNLLRTIPRVVPPPVLRTTYVETGPSLFPGKVELTDGELIAGGGLESVDAHGTVPSTNMLPTIARNLYDTTGVEMKNTLNSDKANPYALHDGEPRAVYINPESPEDDLRLVFTSIAEVVFDRPYLSLLTEQDNFDTDLLFNLSEGASMRLASQSELIDNYLKFALDIVEGNGDTRSKVPGDRAYRGFPLLNHSGHKRVNRVMPVYDAEGNVIAGETTVRQIWYGGRIQSDSMFFDFGWERPGSDVEYANCGSGGQPVKSVCINAPPIPPDVPWKIHYEISVLNRGNDDFSPMTMQFDCPFRMAIGDDKPPIHLARPDASIACPDGSKKETFRAAFAESAPKIAWAAGPLYASLDQSFFPMEDGTRVSIAIDMAPPQYYNLTYTWGWRKHPPRAQSTENAHKTVPPPMPFAPEQLLACNPAAANIIEHERWAFEGFPSAVGDKILPDGVASPPSWMVNEEGDPVGHTCLAIFAGINSSEINDLPVEEQAEKIAEIKPEAEIARRGLFEQFYGKEEDVLNPIDRISDLAPAKRLWRSIKAMQTERKEKLPEDATDADVKSADKRWVAHLLNARSAYLDWLHRSKLPSGIAADPASDVTLLYVNNAIYGEITGGGLLELPNWRRRGDLLKVTLYNGDYFPHGYLNVDFGGARGWENTFKSTLQTAGSGAWFTFGRFHARFNTVPGSIVVDAATRTEADDELPPAAKLSLEQKDRALIAGGAPKYVSPGVHRVMMKMNYEPSPRIKIYQFDPLHHDAAIYSLH